MVEFHVVKCISCCVFQVQQVKVVNKWACLRCGTKQTLQKVYAISAKAKDCRLVCQNLNMAVGEAEEWREDALMAAAGQGPSSWDDVPPEQAVQNKPQHDWSEYVEQEEEDAGGGAEPCPDGFTTELAGSAGQRRKAAAAAAPAPGGRRAPKQQRRLLDPGAGERQGRAMHGGPVRQQQAATGGLGLPAYAGASAASRPQPDLQQRSWQGAGRDDQGHAQSRGTPVHQGPGANSVSRPPLHASKQQQPLYGLGQQQQQQRSSQLPQQQAPGWRSSHQVDATALYSLDTGPTDQQAAGGWLDDNPKHLQRSMQQPSAQAQKPAAAKWEAFVEEEVVEEGGM